MNISAVALDSEIHTGIISGKLGYLAVAQVHSPELQVIHHIGLNILYLVLNDFLVTRSVIGGVPIIFVTAIAIHNQETFVGVRRAGRSAMTDAVEEILVVIIPGFRANCQSTAFLQTSTLLTATANPSIFSGIIIGVQVVVSVEAAVKLIIVEQVGMGRSILGVENRRTKHEKAQDKRK